MALSDCEKASVVEACLTTAEVSTLTLARHHDANRESVARLAVHVTALLQERARDTRT